MDTNAPTKKLLLAFVGMPGSGKSEATAYLRKKGFGYIRFGQITDDGLSEMGLEVTPENEKMYREQIRTQLGMAAYAIQSEEKIRIELSTNDFVVIDGLYSWEEYMFLTKKFPSLQVIFVFADPDVRYARLQKRAVRPFTREEARARDFSEIEKLNKSGPIAISDFVLENNESLEELYKKIDTVLERVTASL